MGREEKLKKQQATNVREQILRQFSVSSVAGLLSNEPTDQGASNA
jgi:hypothetical protein